MAYRKTDKRTILAMFLSAYAVLFSRGGWTRGAAARDGCGISTDPSSRYACKFCAIGALQFADPNWNPNRPLSRQYSEALGILQDAAAKMTPRKYLRDSDGYTYDPVEINDHVGRRATKRMYQRAIASLA